MERTHLPPPPPLPHPTSAKSREIQGKRGWRWGGGGVKGEKAEESQEDFAVLQPGLFSYTVQPLGPPSVNYLRHSADLPLSSV